MYRKQKSVDVEFGNVSELISKMSPQVLPASLSRRGVSIGIITHTSMDSSESTSLIHCNHQQPHQSQGQVSWAAAGLHHERVSRA